MVLKLNLAEYGIFGSTAESGIIGAKTLRSDKDTSSKDPEDKANKTILIQQNSSGNDQMLTQDWDMVDDVITGQGEDVNIDGTILDASKTFQNDANSKLLCDDATGKVLKDYLGFNSHQELAEHTSESDDLYDDFSILTEIEHKVSIEMDKTADKDETAEKMLDKHIILMETMNNRRF